MPRVIGADLSLTSTGLAVIDTHPAGGIHSYQLGVIKSPPLGKAWTDSERRIEGIVAQITPHLDRLPQLLIMESPAFGQTSGASHDRSWLWGRVYHEASVRGVPVITATPQAVKMYATGKGNADKDQVIAALVRRWPAIEGLDNNNAADAWSLATMGERVLGAAVDELPATHVRALEKLRQ